jgi:membrane protein insertase Oxa1/YidC/SpoIIIJ
MLEPTATGSRIRMSTVRGDATIRTQVGLGALAVSGTMSLLLALVPGATGNNWGAVAGIGVMGVVLLVRNVLALPRWAKTRAAQMEALSAEVGEIVDGRG